MFQKFAHAIRTKTIDFFAEEDGAAAAPEADAAAIEVSHDSSEEVIDQTIVVIKPGKPDKAETLQTLISSLFATFSSFKACYLHLQIAHAPFDEDTIEAADRAAVSHLQKLSSLKQFYQDYLMNPGNPNPNLPLASQLEAQVKANQSVLRAFGIVVDRLQSEIDRKDAEASLLREQLGKLDAGNWRLETRLEASESFSPELLLSVGLFHSVLLDVCRSIHAFTKMLIDLMKKARWDLDLAANSLYPGVEYVKKGHNRYAFLSYVCLGMFGGFSSLSFGFEGDEKLVSLPVKNGAWRRKFLHQFVEHGSLDALELLERNPDCDFAKFCENKYRVLIQSTIEPSLLDGNHLAADSWRTSAPCNEAFVNMANLVWMLHKLALSFDPPVEIFQVERGTDFSLVYMHNVTRGSVLADSCKRNARAKVGFTVIPGFKVGKTVIQSQVYLTGSKLALSREKRGR